MRSLIVIDNFYKNPTAVRELALKANYIDVRGNNYPGYQSEKAFVSEALKEKILSLLKEDVEISPEDLTFGKFRVMLADSGSRLKVHIDGHTAWTGLIYLNTDEQAQGGTAFYKHRQTGIYKVLSDKQAQERGFKSWEDLERNIIERDSLEPEAWLQEAFVAMKFNRLVLFRGDQLFHAHTCSFGDNIENGRLTQNFFLKSKSLTN